MDIALIFEPSDMRRLERSEVAITLVNDTEYSVSFAILRHDGSHGRRLWSGCVEAVTQLVLSVVPMREMDILKEFTFQAIMYREDTEFEEMVPLNIGCRFETASLLKESSYKRPLYSEKPAHELYLLKEGNPVSYSVPDAEKIRKALAGSLDKAFKEKIAADCGRGTKRHRGQELSPYKVLPPIEVDLHIHELIDSTVGMDNTDMLMLQLDTVRRTMSMHRRRRGQEIVFIHGKGDGVLRKALLDLLRREFPTAAHRDASFIKYGFGATLVTIGNDR